MDQEQIISKLKKQLLIERAIGGGILVIAAVWWISSLFAGGRSVIVVDGHPVACVSSDKDARSVLSTIKSERGMNPLEVEFRQDVHVARAPREASLMSRGMAVRAVRQVVSPVVSRWAIIADGKPVVAVPSRKIAGQVLEMAKLKFGAQVKQLAEEPQIKEDVTVDMASVSPAIYVQTAQQAMTLIFSPQAPVSRDAVYTVRSGDVAGSIAKRMGLSQTVLQTLNPGRNLDRLQIGDTLNVKQSARPKAGLTVVVRDQSERTESMPAPIQRVSSASLFSGKMVELSPGRPGKRIVKVADIYENGVKVNSEVMEETVLIEPSPRRIAVGIKNRS